MCGRTELGQIARRLSADLKSAEADLYGLRGDSRGLHEAMFELESVAQERSNEGERFGFVYLIGHARAVKIGWSEKHPLTPGGRLADLQVASCDALELLGLIEAPFARERQIQARFSAHRLRGEWFLRHQEILSYFTENGIGNEAR